MRKNFWFFLKFPFLLPKCSVYLSWHWQKVSLVAAMPYKTAAIP